ncbi:MAG: hypothetical protein ABI467_25290 [Kofleriaceae bacterium]
MIRLLVIASVLSGCFYTDPINQRPSIAIHQTVQGAITRGQRGIEFSAITNDPDGDSVAVTWRAYACISATVGAVCDPAEFQSGADSTFTVLQVPYRNAAGNSFDTLELRLDGHDALGATAKPSQTLDLHLDDAGPVVTMRADPRPAVDATPIGIYALVTDADDDVDDPQHPYQVDWNVTAPPMSQDFDLAPLTVAGSDANHLQLGKTFTPHGVGDWTIQVTATDPQLRQTVEHLTVHVNPDEPPCLAQWAPAATTDPGTTLPLTDPTLFQVLVVTDDLDPYPSVPNDPVYGTTEFSWSIVPPGGSRQALPNVTGNAVALDPGSYLPGDLVELRVEVEDRMHRAVTCPDGDLTCSLTTDTSCSQRLTWRVEVR